METVDIVYASILKKSDSSERIAIEAAELGELHLALVGGGQGCVVWG